MKGVLAAALLGLACRADPIPEARRFPAGTPYAPRSVVVEGTRIRYLSAGDGPAVVLVHGLGGSMYSWRNQLMALDSAGFRVVALDNRGFGFSDRPETGYRNADQARVIVGLMDSLGIDDATLVGHSMGGAIAAEVALAAPDRVPGLALLASAGFGTRHPLLVRLAGWPVAGALATALRGRTITADILRSTYADPAKVTAQDVDQYYAPVATPEYGRALRGVMREFDFEALSGRLERVRAPALVLWGERDQWIPVAVGRRLAQEIGRVAFLIVPATGHALQEEAPAAVNGLLIGYLTEGLPRVPANLAWSWPIGRSSRIRRSSGTFATASLHSSRH